MAQVSRHSPYRGPAYFTVQDRKFFFGRENDTRRVTDTVQTARLSMVHAPSGAGKTSVLRASVIPTLDGLGRDACYLRPGPDPARTVRCAVLLRCVSPPAREAAALSQAVAAFLAYRHDTESGGDTETTLDAIHDMPLQEFCDAYAAIPPDHPAHRDMIVGAKEMLPEILENPQTHSVAGLSMAGRLLIALRGVEIYRHYLVRLCRLFGLEIYGLDDLGELQAMSVGQIIGFLSDMAEREDYVAAITPLLNAGETLADFFNALSDKLDAPGSTLPMRHVVIIDQFEEFFTRFGDGADASAGSGKVTDRDFDYHVRDDFFTQIAALLKPEFWADRDEVRIVISLRDDYVARLGGFELACGEIGLAQRNAIPMLSPLDIEDVVRGPARIFGVTYDDDVLDKMIVALRTEGRYILPIKVQIVCERLWRDHLANGTADRITRRAFDRYGGADGDTEAAIRRIIENYVGETLDALPLIERMDAIRVLASMMTLEGTREVVPYERLTEKTFVNRDLRRKILKKLSDDSIITLEAHRGGRSVEIKHEFLLSSIHRNLRQSRKQFPEWQVLQSAIENLEQGLGPTHEQLIALWKHSDVLEPAILRDGLARKLFQLSTLEPSSLDLGDRKAWLTCWTAWFERPKPAAAEEVVADATSGNASTEDLRKLRAVEDWSAVAGIKADELARLIRNAIRQLPAHDAIPILTEVRRHVGRTG